MLQPNVDGQTIKIRDMPIQQDDGDLRPGLGVNDGSTSVAFYWCHTFSSHTWLGRTYRPQKILSALCVSRDKGCGEWGVGSGRSGVLHAPDSRLPKGVSDTCRTQ